MSTPIMQVKLQDFDTPEKRGKYTVSVIGCGQASIPTILFFVESGLKVACVDADQTVVDSISKGRAPGLAIESEKRLKASVKTGRLTATDDIKRAVGGSDLIALSVPVKIGSRRKPDYSNLEKACKGIGSALRPGSLVLMMSLTGIGATERLIRETLENTSGMKAGNEFGLAYSPFHSVPDETLTETINASRIIAASDQVSLNAASTVFQAITKKTVVKTQSIKTAEIAALFERLLEDIETATVNELALFCEKAGADIREVSRLVEARTGELLLRSSSVDRSTEGGSYIMLEDAENLNTKLRIPMTARAINEEVGKRVLNLVKDALKTCGKTLGRARISMLGISPSPNKKGFPKKLVKEVAAILESRGAKVNLYDPYFKENEVVDIQTRVKKTLTDSLEGADCAIILTGHDQFKRLNLKKLKHIMKMPAAIIDLEGILDPHRVEEEGVIYRGLGRGVWTK